jgi:tRNA (guanine26-N2/guanine27-N2)-dimethyltransferase
MAAKNIQVVEYDGKQYDTVQEGLARILNPISDKKRQGKSDEAQLVFYNPIQQFNRDLSVLAIKAYGEQIIEKRTLKRKEKNQEKRKRKREQADEGSEKPAKIGKPSGDDVQPKTEELAVGTDAKSFGDSKLQKDEISADTVVSETAKPNGTNNEKVHHSHATAGNGSQPSHPPKPGQFTILDALSATGLRALRFAHELPFVTSVTANDLTASAVESIKRNVKYNELEAKINITNDDAIGHMYSVLAKSLSNRDRAGNPAKGYKYDVIDLDPYGTAAPFLDAAIQSVREDGGLLCITCTDASNWAGHCYTEKCFALYGGVPIKGLHSHEAGLRIVLHAISTTAARYGLAIEPLLSLSIDFYCRVFVKVTKSAQQVKFLGSKTMLMYNCDSGCSAWAVQPLMKSKPTPNKSGGGHFFKYFNSLGPVTGKECEHCGTLMHVGGPMYGGPLHSPAFIQRILDLLPGADGNIYKTVPRIEGMLQTALEEILPGPPIAGDFGPINQEQIVVDHYPFFIMPSKICSVLKCTTIPDDMLRGALVHLGYRTTRSHCRPGSVKTDAPWSTIWWVIKEWIRQKSPIKTENIQPNSPAWKILQMGKDSSDLQNAAPDKRQPPQLQGGQTAASPADRPETGEQSEETPGAQELELRKTLVFDEQLGRLGKQKGARRLVRYQMNPRENWGPMTRAKGQ